MYVTCWSQSVMLYPCIIVINTLSHWLSGCAPEVFLARICSSTTFTPAHSLYYVLIWHCLYHFSIGLQCCSNTRIKSTNLHLAFHSTLWTSTFGDKAAAVRSSSRTPLVWCSFGGVVQSGNVDDQELQCAGSWQRGDHILPAQAEPRRRMV